MLYQLLSLNSAIKSYIIYQIVLNFGIQVRKFVLVLNIHYKHALLWKMFSYFNRQFLLYNFQTYNKFFRRCIHCNQLVPVKYYMNTVQYSHMTNTERGRKKEKSLTWQFLFSDNVCPSVLTIESCPFLTVLEAIKQNCHSRVVSQEGPPTSSPSRVELSKSHQNY